jgi:2-polyprenyl-3-methyl-5-hydroxy-6-metoxy-1,4-benzoquinol methylase
MCLNHQLAQFNQQQAEAFAERLITALNEGALCNMLSIGHRTGLLDAMANMQPASSNDIAQQAGLNERYVREWLGALTVAGVVTYDPATRRYALPDEHAAFLGRQAGGDNIAVFAQYIPMMGSVEDDIVDCFKNGGGVPYEKFPRFHEVMAEDSGSTVLSSLLEHILPLVPGLTEKLQQGIKVLDVGCGRGRALNLLAANFPNSEFVGYDLSEEAISYARNEAIQLGNNNVRFEQKDVTNFEQDADVELFDLVTTFDAVHDQAQPLAVLKGIYKALKHDGVYLMQDIHSSSDVSQNIEHPVGTLLYSLSTTHCMTVSLAQGGEGLGTMWGQEKAVEYLHKAGFKTIAIQQLEHDFQNDYYVIRKS